MAQKMSVSNKRNVKTLSRKEKDERKQQVLKLYQEGLPPKAIAREMGRSMSLIYNIIAELKEEGKIVNEKPFENVEVRDAVIMYMINRKYTDREIGRLIDVCVNTIQNIKNRKERLTDEKINEIIKEKASEIEFANAMYIERKVDSNEKKLIELLQQNELNLKEIAEQLQMSMNGLKKVLEHLIFQGKIDAKICTRAMQDYMEEKKMKTEFDRKKYNSEKSTVSSVKRCRKELKLLIKRAEVKEISEDEKSRYFELCKQIVKSGERLTLEEIEALSDSIAYGEGEVDLEAIKFIANEYAKAENLKPALQLINTCIADHGENKKLEEARNIVLGLYKKQVIRTCLKQGFSVEETMARAGASENEVREIKRQYLNNNKQKEICPAKKAEVGR
jgi:hypothetical protein